jgi:uncharacterized protein (TIGR00369 family)
LTDGEIHALDRGELQTLTHYFNEAVTFGKHIGATVEAVEPGSATMYVDAEDVHFNGNGTLHGGVYASLIDSAMGLAVMNVHFLGAVGGGRVTCRADVVHRTRRTATAEAKVHDAEGNLVAMGTGAFRVFEKKGNAIV